MWKNQLADKTTNVRYNVIRKRHIVSISCQLDLIDNLVRNQSCSISITGDGHDITEILLKVALNTINQTKHQ
jgi:hypothetical protein